MWFGYGEARTPWRSGNECLLRGGCKTLKSEKIQMMNENNKLMNCLDKYKVGHYIELTPSLSAVIDHLQIVMDG